LHKVAERFCRPAHPEPICQGMQERSRKLSWHVVYVKQMGPKLPEHAENKDK